MIGGFTILFVGFCLSGIVGGQYNYDWQQLKKRHCEARSSHVVKRRNKTWNIYIDNYL